MLIAHSTKKPLHSYLFPHLLSTTSAHPCYKHVAQIEDATLKFCEDVAGARRTQSPIDRL
jgi:hypothetical protein